MNEVCGTATNYLFTEEGEPVVQLVVVCSEPKYNTAMERNRETTTYRMLMTESGVRNLIEYLQETEKRLQGMKGRVAQPEEKKS